MTDKSTTTLIEDWFELRMEIDRLTEEADAIKAKVEKRKEIVILDGAECIETFKGVYDWGMIALEFNPDPEVIERFSTTAWNKVAEVCAPTAAALKIAKEKFYNQGEKFFQLRLKKAKK